MKTDAVLVQVVIKLSYSRVPGAVREDCVGSRHTQRHSTSLSVQTFYITLNNELLLSNILVAYWSSMYMDKINSQFPGYANSWTTIILIKIGGAF